MAITFGVRKFNTYLKYSALPWLLEAKEPEGQMVQWIQELGTYEFSVADPMQTVLENG